jgi:hypothetical protein
MKGFLFGTMFASFVIGSVFVASTETHSVVKNANGKLEMVRHYSAFSRAPLVEVVTYNKPAELLALNSNYEF